LSNQDVQERWFPLVLADGEPVRLQAKPGSSRFAFSMRQRYALVHVRDDADRGPWKVRTLDYEYAVYAVTRNGSDQPRELFAYHFHPSSERSRIKRPHVHFRSVAVTTAELEAAHFPTGRVALEEVVWMLLDERDNQFGVKPSRPDWREVLHEGLAAFEQWRTWPGLGGPMYPLT
jgi:hypothetical protein